MSDKSRVPRPTKKSEYSIYFDSPKMFREWNILEGARLSNLTDAWDFLTRAPLQRTPLSKPMLGRFAFVTRDGIQYERWQLKLSQTSGARIWYYVSGQSVYIEQLHTKHPNETK